MCQPIGASRARRIANRSSPCPVWKHTIRPATSRDHRHLARGTAQAPRHPQVGVHRIVPGGHGADAVHGGFADVPVRAAAGLPGAGRRVPAATCPSLCRSPSGQVVAVGRLAPRLRGIGSKPGLMRDLVKSLLAEGLTDADAGVKRFLLDDRQVAGWSALLQSHDPFERAVLLAIAHGLPPMGRETLNELAKVRGSRPTVAKVRAAIERLRRAGLLVKAGSGPTAVDDPLFAEYLRTDRW